MSGPVGQEGFSETKDRPLPQPPTEYDTNDMFSDRYNFFKEKIENWKTSPSASKKKKEGKSQSSSKTKAIEQHMANYPQPDQSLSWNFENEQSNAGNLSQHSGLGYNQGQNQKSGGKNDVSPTNLSYHHHNLTAEESFGKNELHETHEKEHQKRKTQKDRILKELISAEEEEAEEPRQPVFGYLAPTEASKEKAGSSLSNFGQYGYTSEEKKLTRSHSSSSPLADTKNIFKDIDNQVRGDLQLLNNSFGDSEMKSPQPFRKSKSPEKEFSLSEKVPNNVLTSPQSKKRKLEMPANLNIKEKDLEYLKDLQNVLTLFSGLKGNIEKLNRDKHHLKEEFKKSVQINRKQKEELMAKTKESKERASQVEALEAKNKALQNELEEMKGKLKQQEEQEELKNKLAEKDSENTKLKEKLKRVQVDFDVLMELLREEVKRKEEPSGFGSTQGGFSELPFRKEISQQSLKYSFDQPPQLYDSSGFPNVQNEGLNSNQGLFSEARKFN